MVIKNLVVISDTHCGDQLALCPPEITLAHGGTYRYSRFQKFIYECWREFWDQWVPKVTRGEPYAVLFNGDMLEGRHHNATHPISNNKADQANIAYELMAPVVSGCGGRFFFVTGTPVHAGEAGEDEEKLAERLGAVPDEMGRRSRYEIWIQVGKALLHASHHIGITGSMAYETTALTKEYNEFCAESARWKQKIPDIIARAHRHRHSEVRVPTASGYGIIFVTPSWQLRTPYTFKIPGGRTSTPMIGGCLIRQGDEEFYTRHRTWKTARSKTVVI